MNVLLVEDEKFKSENILSLLRDALPNSGIRTARSLAEASSLLQSEIYHLLILDMSLPTYSINQSEAGGRPQGFGGTSILRLIDALGVTVPTVVVTQFVHFGEGSERIDLDGLREQLAQEFEDTFHGLVFYDAASETWKAELRELVAQIQMQGIRR